MFSAALLSYQDTGFFSKIVIDYVQGSQSLKPFYALPPATENIEEAIATKKNTFQHRDTLVNVLRRQYKVLPPSDTVSHNIDLLASAETFTICTAHQPNLFTGPLYFIYKIIHAIKLAKHLKSAYPHHHFVPVYYMGCEDADLPELNHITVQGKKYVWDTDQKGAVGRMKVDQSLIRLLDELSGQIGLTPHGLHLINLFRSAYKEGALIQDATMFLVHTLFERYGLVVLNPDDKELKKTAVSVFAEDLFQQLPSIIVQNTSQRLDEVYKVQAHPRDINLFYLKDNIRQRIEKSASGYKVQHTSIVFTEEELHKELELYPERFSPNVILRGLFQEIILPNIAFIGGGGELAYWLQLKDLFHHFSVPFPMLVLRNSFLIVEEKQAESLKKWSINSKQIFKDENTILDAYISEKGAIPSLHEELKNVQLLYEAMANKTFEVDATLKQHTEALKAKATSHIKSLEKKMQRAERRKHTDLHAFILKSKQSLFPGGGLQERVENFSWFYAKWGGGFIDALLQHSLTLQQQFVVLQELKTEGQPE